METTVNERIVPDTQRQSGIELFRIISMLLIVAHHYVVNSGVQDLMYETPLALRSIFLFLFGGWGKTGINCFMLITGYFMCKSNVSAKKFFKLLLEIWFYRIAVYLIFLLSGRGYENFSLTRIAKVLLPVSSVTSNFTGCFLLFYLCIPFLNILLRNTTEKQHLLLLALSCLIYVVLGSIPKITVNMNYVSWFIVLYFIAAYVRLYPKKWFESKKIWGFALLAVFIVSAVSIVACLWLGTKFNKEMAFYFVADSNKILAIATAFCGFIFFKNWKIQSKFINSVAASTFGVLLIHASSDAMREWLWQDVCKVPDMYGSSWLVLHAIGCVLAVFIVCTVIDWLRIRFLEKPFMKKFGSKIEKIDTFFKEKGENE